MTETRPRKAMAERLRRMADALDPTPQPENVAAAAAATDRPGAPEHWLARLEEAGVSTAAYRTGAEPEGAARKEMDPVHSSGGILTTGLRHLARRFSRKSEQQQAGITTAEAPAPERTQTVEHPGRAAPAHSAQEGGMGRVRLARGNLDGVAGSPVGAQQRQENGAPMWPAAYPSPKPAGKGPALGIPSQSAQPVQRSSESTARTGPRLAATGAKGSPPHLPTSTTDPNPEAGIRSPVSARKAAAPSPGMPAPAPGVADSASDRRTDDADPRSTDPDGRRAGRRPAAAAGRLVLNVGRGLEGRSAPGSVPKYPAAVFRSGDGTSHPTGNDSGARTAGGDGNEAVTGRGAGNGGSPAGFEMHRSAVPHPSPLPLPPAPPALPDTGQKQGAVPASPADAASLTGPDVPAAIPEVPPWPDLPAKDRLAGSAAASQAAAQGQWLDALARASRLAAEQGAR